uniref:Peptidase M14 carboxypeptidase A domain-containing protein n=1 Tax=Meloidogyne javanica TaxID=6303 RepID=A0A915MR18_MELJA
MELKNITRSINILKSEENNIQIWKVHSQPGMPAEIFSGPESERKLLDFFDDKKIVYSTLIEDFGLQMRVSGETLRYELLDEWDEELITNIEEFDLGQNPKIAKFESIGKTTELRDLGVLKLGYAPFNNKTIKPIFLLDGGIHAREWIAPAVALNVINALLKNFEGLWRHTRSGPYKTTKLCGIGDAPLCYGVDPNRNFPYHWAETGTDPCPCSEVYPGPTPLSEPECAHLAAYMNKNKNNLKAYLTLHAYGNLIIHGWNYAARTYPDNVEELRVVAEKMAKAIVQEGGAPFKIGSAPDILYEAAGGSDDYATSLGVKYSYTMELTSGRYDNLFGGFIFPERGIKKEAAKVLPGIYQLALQVYKDDLKL